MKNGLGSDVFQLAAWLKCGRKGCGRNLAKVSVTWTRDRRHNYHMVRSRPWLNLFVPTGVPYEEQRTTGNNYPDRYKFICGWAPSVVAADGSIPRGRDRARIESRGCGAEHVIRHDTVERKLLNLIGVDDASLLVHPARELVVPLIMRYRQEGGHWAITLD